MGGERRYTVREKRQRAGRSARAVAEDPRMTR
jgi:hypothetical protein